MPNIQCSRCREYLDKEKHFRKGSKKCKYCCNETGKKWYFNNKDKVKKNLDKKRYYRDIQKALEDKYPVIMLRKAFKEVEGGHIFEFREGILKPRQCLTEREFEEMIDE